MNKKYLKYTAVTDFSVVESDFDPEFVDEYAVNTPEAQVERSIDFVNNLVRTASNFRENREHFMKAHKKFLGWGETLDYILYSGLICLNLDKEHKIKLLEDLATRTVNGKPVEVFLPKQGDRFEIGLRW